VSDNVKSVRVACAVQCRVKCAVKAEMLHEHFLTYIFLEATFIRALKRGERGFLKVQYAPHQG